MIQELWLILKTVQVKRVGTTQQTADGPISAGKTIVAAKTLTIRRAPICTGIGRRGNCAIGFRIRPYPQPDHR